MFNRATYVGTRNASHLKVDSLVVTGTDMVSGPPVVGQVLGAADNVGTLNYTSVDHTSILNNGTNTHDQIDTHIADATIHFSEASISHNNIDDNGTNTHAQIDTHIADATLHFTEASISHNNIDDNGTNTHAQIDTHIADGSIHFSEASISHNNIDDNGTNTHAQIDTHIADSTIHYTQANITNTGTLGSLTVSGDLNVDSNTLFVHSTNNRVGIGINNPSSNLHISSGTSGDCVLIIESDTDNSQTNDNPQIFMKQKSEEFSFKIGMEGASGTQYTGSLLNSGFLMASENIQFVTGTTARMIVDAIGDVGIATNNPTNQLHLYRNSTSTTPQLKIQNAGTGDTAILFDSATDWVMGVDNSDGDKFKIDSATTLPTTPHFCIETGGDIGIGTNDPRANLHVMKASVTIPTLGLQTLLMLENDNDCIFQFLTPTNRSNFIHFGDTSDVDVGFIEYSHTSNYMRFATNVSERMRIESGGDVGIGTSNPDVRLHVHKASAGSASSNSNAVLTLENSTHCALQLISPNASERAIYFGDVTSDVDGGIVYNNTGTVNGLQFRTNGNSTRMVINSTGGIGIGTTSPNARFHVVGDQAMFTNGQGQDEGIFLIPENFQNGNAGGRIYFKEDANNTLGCSIGYNGHLDNTILNWGTNSFNISMHNSSTTGAKALTILRASLAVLISRSSQSADIFEVTGDAGKTVGGTSWNSISDKRVKRDIIDVKITSCLDNINKIKLHKYKYQDWYYSEKDKKLKDREYLGIITQELIKSHPSCVRINEGYEDYDIDIETGITRLDLGVTSINVKRIDNLQTFCDMDWLIHENFGAVQCLSNKINDLVARLEVLEKK